MIVSALLLPFLLLVGLALGSRSQFPIFLGRYSAALLVLNIAGLCSISALMSALRRKDSRLAGPALLLAIFISYVIPANNEILRLRFFYPLVYGSRIGLGLFAVWIGFKRGQAARRVHALRWIALGAVFLTLTLIDCSFYRGFLKAQQRVVSADGFRFRSPIVLKNIEAHSIVVVGDSMVWGKGVGGSEAFPVILQTLLTFDDPSGKVYNLGQIGAGLNEYLWVVKALPRVKRIVVCFYMNDMPPRQILALKIREGFLAAGKTSVFLRLLGDFMGFKMHPTRDSYLRSVIADYEKQDPTFHMRWRLLTDRLHQIAEEAGRCSDRPPILVLLPLVMNFPDYPLRTAHEELCAVANRLGFQVVDMLPEFSRKFRDGRALLLSPRDNHFNKEGHRMTAERLAGFLRSSP